VLDEQEDTARVGVRTQALAVDSGLCSGRGGPRRITARVSASGPLARPSELTFTLSRAVQGTARARPKVRKPLNRYVNPLSQRNLGILTKGGG
jgi:hypothetical protein